MNARISELPADRIATLVADTSPYLSCDECFARLDEFVERRVEDPGYQEVAMDAHLLGCGACAEEAETLVELLSQDLA
jgi:hypothetical protein